MRGTSPRCRRRAGGDGAGGAAHDQLRAEDVLGAGGGGAGHLVEQDAGDGRPHLADRLPHGGQRRVGELGHRGVVAADDRHVLGHPQAAPARLADGAQRHRVGATHDGGGAAVEQGAGRPLAALDAEHRGLHEVVEVGHRADVAPHRLVEPGDLAGHRHVPRLAGGQTDAGVAEADEVLDGEVHPGGVVAADERRLEALAETVDQHQVQPAPLHLDVPLRVGRRVGVVAADEHRAGDAALHQHLHVLVLLHAAGRLGAQHRRPAGLREGGLDHLGHVREDRVVELGHQQADEPGRAPPAPGGTLVPQLVERRQHGGAHRLRDGGAPAHHPAHGGCADTCPGRDVTQSHDHVLKPSA